MRHFVESSRRMAHTLERPPTGRRPDPGEVLVGLLGFADEIARFQPARNTEPLAFPPLARLAQQTVADRTGRGDSTKGTGDSTEDEDGARDVTNE
jgi:hypothetical protein